MLEEKALNVFFLVVAVPSFVLWNPRKRLAACWAKRLASLAGLLGGFSGWRFFFEDVLPIVLGFFRVNVFLVVVAVPPFILRNPSERLTAGWTGRLTLLLGGFRFRRGSSRLSRFSGLLFNFHFGWAFTNRFQHYKVRCALHSVPLNSLSFPTFSFHIQGDPGFADFKQDILNFPYKTTPRIDDLHGNKCTLS